MTVTDALIIIAVFSNQNIEALTYVFVFAVTLTTFELQFLHLILNAYFETMKIKFQIKIDFEKFNT